MIQETMRNQASSDEFEVKVSGFFLFIKWSLRVGATWILFVTIVQSFKEGQHFAFINGIIGFALYCSISEFAIRSFPRRVTKEGEKIVFHKMPNAWISLGGIPIPLGITQRCEFKREAVYLEWIGKSLALNDMDKGKSIRLAAGNHAKELAAWFRNAGVREPIGG